MAASPTSAPPGEAGESACCHVAEPLAGCRRVPTRPCEERNHRRRSLSVIIPFSAISDSRDAPAHTTLYNQNPTWLQLAHKALDDAVFDAYGWPHDLEDEEILERLLALNLERAGVTDSKQVRRRR